MNQLQTPNPHSVTVIASNHSTLPQLCSNQFLLNQACASNHSTLPQLCSNQFLLNQVCLYEPEAEHKTQSV